MDPAEKKRLHDLLHDPDFGERIRSALQKSQERFAVEATQMVRHHFPEHADHTWQEGEWEFFDALFVAYTLNCSCGANLRVTREMLDER